MIALSASRKVTNDLPLYLICAVQMLLQLDVSIVNVALASMDRDLGFAGGLQWVAGGYALAYGSLLLVGGRLADRLGYKPALLWGLLAFALASLVGGLATHPTVLVGARVAQGIAAAAVAPAALALLTTLFETPAERARALGFSQAAMAGGATIAVIVGGALVELFGWRAVMLVNLPLIAILLPLLALRVPTRGGTTARASWLPPAMVSLALCGIVSGLGLAESEGFLDPVVIGLVAAGLVVGAAWLVGERRSATPMLPGDFFASRQRAAALFTIFGLGGVMAGYVFFVTLYLQRVVGLPPFMTGLALVPSTVMVMGVSLLVGRSLIGKWGLKPVLLAGVGLVALGQALLAAAGGGPYWTTVLPGLVVTAGGMGLALPAASVAFMAGVDERIRGTAGGLIVTAQQIGVAASLSALVAVAGGGGTDYAFATAFLGTAGLATLTLLVLLVGFPRPARRASGSA
jgi:MFS family permease